MGLNDTQSIARVLTHEVVVGAVIHVGLTGRDGVEDFEGTDKLASGLEVDGEGPIGK
mgnify:CR=1 FL=1